MTPGLALLLDQMGFTIAGFGTVFALAAYAVVNQIDVTGLDGERIFVSSDLRPFFKKWMRRPANWLAYGPGNLIAVALVLVGVIMQLPSVWMQHVDKVP